MPENKHINKEAAAEEKQKAGCPSENQAEASGTAEETASSEPHDKDSKKKKDERPDQEQLQEEVEKLKKELDAEKDVRLRLMAEYDNFRKRSQKEKSELYPEAVANAVMAFLPALDNFERALALETADTEFKKGFEMVFNQLKENLSRLKVEEIGAAGDAFNPNLHNAVMHVEDDSFGAGVVCEVFQKGYKLGDKIIRCAMVKVAN